MDPSRCQLYATTRPPLRMAAERERFRQLAMELAGEAGEMGGEAGETGGCWASAGQQSDAVCDAGDAADVDATAQGESPSGSRTLDSGDIAQSVAGVPVACLLGGGRLPVLGAGGREVGVGDEAGEAAAAVLGAEEPEPRPPSSAAAERDGVGSGGHHRRLRPQPQHRHPGHGFHGVVYLGIHLLRRNPLHHHRIWQHVSQNILRTSPHHDLRSLSPFTPIL